MKSLVVFYSRTGTTRIVARAIADNLKGDLEEIRDLKNRKGALGFVISCKDGGMKKCAEIGPLEKDPAGYDLVLVGTPVWANSMACAVRTWLREKKDALTNVVFFCTTGKSGIETCFKHMEEESGKKPVAVLGLTTKEVRKNQIREKLAEFLKNLPKGE